MQLRSMLRFTIRGPYSDQHLYDRLQPIETARSLRIAPLAMHDLLTAPQGSTSVMERSTIAAHPNDAQIAVAVADGVAVLARSSDPQGTINEFCATLARQKGWSDANVAIVQLRLRRTMYTPNQPIRMGNEVPRQPR